MKAIARIVTALAAGAALMYYLDPQVGRRRRAVLRDRGTAATYGTRKLVQTNARRMANRTRGALAQAGFGMSRPEIIDDGRLHDRIRARLGHLIEHPRDIDVGVQQGYVVLRGHASIEEIEELTIQLSEMPGVTGLDNRLSPLNGLARP